jgi:hypothetical protein
MPTRWRTLHIDRRTYTHFAPLVVRLTTLFDTGHTNTHHTASNVFVEYSLMCRYQRAEDDKKKRDLADEDAQRTAYLQVDWHDFVIVEKIEFDDDEVRR